ncbi:MAG: hypothetical protein Rubg2KO_04600 [Rubricoccaceae bacterium]
MHLFRIALLSTLCLAGCGGASSTQATDPFPAYDLVFLSGRSGTSHLYRLNVETRALSQMTSGDSSVFAPQWSPLRAALLYVSNKTDPASVIQWDTDTPRILYPDPSLDEGPTESPVLPQIAFSDGQDIYIADTQGTNPRRVTSDSATDKQPRWSPDGRQLVFVSDRAGNQDIWTLDLATQTFRNLTQHPALEGHPEWSPDGTRILYYRYENGDADLYIADVETGEARNLTQSEGNELVGQWSPDGTWIAFGSARTDDWDLYRVRHDGSDLERLTDSPGFDGAPAWIPSMY